jgi:hypothetical protein
MTKSMMVVGGFAGLVVLLSGCSGADEGSTGGGKTETATKTPKTPGTATTEQDQTAPGPDSPAVECVPEGAKGNELGVGAYCQKSTECKSGTFCTAGQAPKGAEFCTAFCSSDADCGEGATCYTDPRGRACAPSACLAPKSK